MKGGQLAKSFGSCDGRGNSLRAEAVGMLGISPFVALMAKHRNRINIKIKFVTDNLDLVNRSKEHLNYKHPYPNNTLESEYEITKQIYLTNTTYHVEAMFQHVYRHQDSKSNRELTIEEKLNVVADKLAGQYQNELGSYCPIAHMYPSTPDVLEINNMTITSNIRHHLIKAYTEPRYMRYLQ